MEYTLDIDILTALKHRGYCLKFQIWNTTVSEVLTWLYTNHDILVSVKRCVIGTDEWVYGYEISYLPKEFEDAKRRSPHLVLIESFKEGTSSYVGGWHTPKEAYLEAIQYCLSTILK